MKNDKIKQKQYIVDTNVPLAANGKSDFSLKCQVNCIEILTEIVNTGHIVIDNLNLIIGEYCRKLSRKGQPGSGDHFLKWVITNEYNSIRCTRVTITPIGEITKIPTNFNEFPSSADLKYFDPNDKKFVAVANAHPQKPPILQATDTKWWGWATALEEFSIIVQFICLDEIKQRYEKKYDK